MTGPHAWILGGLALCALELLAPGFFLLPVGLAACVAGLLANLVPLAPAVQIGLFVVVAIALAVALRRQRRPADAVNAPTAGLIGATCQALAFHDGEGRVRLRDGAWQARLTEGPDPSDGDTLRIVGLDGTTLLVARA